MKAFRFALQPLLSLRSWKEQAAREELARLSAEVARIQEDIQRFEAAKKAIFADWNAAAAERFMPRDRLALGERVAQTESEARKAREALAEADARREKALQAALQAANERKAVEKLKERRRQESLALGRKREAAEIEDIHNARRTGRTQ